MQKNLITLIILNNLANAQSYEEWLKAQNQEMNDYVQKENQAFQSYMEQQWKDYDQFKKDLVNPKPKPKETPKTRPAPLGQSQAKVSSTTPQSSQKISSSSLRSSSSQKVIPLSSQVKPSSALSSSTQLSSSSALKVSSSSLSSQTTSSSALQISSSSAVVTQQSTFDFFGIPKPLLLPKSLKANKLRNVDEESIKDWMGDFAKIDTTIYKKFQAELQKMDHGWLTLQYAWKSTQEIFPKDSNSSLLLMWALLQQNGFDLRIGYNHNKITLLYHSKEKVFAIPRLDIEGHGYYPFVPSGKSKVELGALRTWPSPALPNSFPVDLTLRNAPLASALSTREVSFEYFDTKYQFKIPRNEAMEKFLDTYPFVELNLAGSHRFATPQVKALVEQLKAVSSKKNKTDALNIVLRMVQLGFPYKIDEEQFGYERYFFAEEMMHFPYSDCEDRSVFFAQLVKEVFGWEVVLLDYPAHIATAVLMPEPPEWAAKIDYNGKKWVICDPTYINANIGTEMPEMMMHERKIIPLD